VSLRSYELKESCNLYHTLPGASCHVEFGRQLDIEQLVHNSIMIQCPLEQIIGSFVFKSFVACVFEEKVIFVV